jgi:hypothetical protein
MRTIGITRTMLTKDADEIEQTALLMPLETPLLRVSR